MSMKTIEEKRVAVLAYCDQEFSKIESAPYRIWHGQISVAMGLGRIFGIYLGSQKLIFEFWKDLNCRDSRWESAYQLLGLSERDAVAEKDARIQQLKDELLRLTSEQETNCEEYVKTLTQDADYGLNKQISALEAKNAALVAFAKHCATTFEGKGLATMANEALAANEKGGNGE